MSRDYKHRTSRNTESSSREQTTVPVWRWLLVFLVLGGFVASLLWLKSKVSSTIPNAVVSKPKKQPLKYEFYNVLPEREVIIPEYQIETQKRLERQRVKQSSGKPQASEQYMIQAGAFEIYREADKRKAQLILMGQNAYLEKAIMDGKTWHRVKIGPFSSLNKADSVRKLLAEESIQSVIMKQKS